MHGVHSDALPGSGPSSPANDMTLCAAIEAARLGQRRETRSHACCAVPGLASATSSTREVGSARNNARMA